MSDRDGPEARQLHKINTEKFNAAIGARSVPRHARQIVHVDETSHRFVVQWGHRKTHAWDVSIAGELVPHAPGSELEVEGPVKMFLDAEHKDVMLV